MWDEYGNEISDYTALVSEPPLATPEAGGGGLSGTLADALKSFTSRFSTKPSSTSDTVGSSIYNAIYAFGAGKIDQARESAARALLASKTGSGFVSEVERQRLMQMLPLILVGIVAIFGLMMLLRR